MRKFCIQHRIARLLCALACLADTRCAGSLQRPPTLPPLENEGELYVEVRPFMREVRGTRLQVDSAAAIAADGVLVPLALRRQSLSATEMNGSRLLAEARLPPGAYRGISLLFRGAKADGATAQETPAEPVRVEGAFTVAAGRATLVLLELHAPRSRDAAPAFTLALPAKTLASLTGYCSNAAAHDLTVFDKRSREVTAVLPTGRGPFGVAIDPISNRVYVALSGEDEIEVLDVQSSARIARIRLGVGDVPRDVALTPDRRLLLSANSGSRTVSLIDPDAMVELGRLPAGEEPTWVLPDRRAARAYVFNAQSNAITVLDLANRSVIASLATDERPVLRGQLDRAGTRLYVPQPRSGYLIVFSLPDLSVQKRVYVGLGISALKVDPVSDLIYVGHRGEGRLAVYDPFSFIPLDQVEVPDWASFMAIDEAQNALLVLMPESRSVAAVDLNERRVSAVFDVGSDPRVLAVMGERN